MSRASIRRATRSSDLGKLMREAAGRHHLWDVFSDFCEMAAISIANAVDLGPARAGREARYLDRIGRYEPREQALFPQMLAALVDRLEAGPDDVLGNLFGELELGNSDRGQFFTPFELCRLMAQIQIGEKGLDGPIAERGFVTVNEPACGAGAMIIAFADAMRQAGYNPQQQMHATCQDIDSRGVHMCYLQLALLHIPATDPRQLGLEAGPQPAPTGGACQRQRAGAHQPRRGHHRGGRDHHHPDRATAGTQAPGRADGLVLTNPCQLPQRGRPCLESTDDSQRKHR